jgi:hypothetical protein
MLTLPEGQTVGTDDKPATLHKCEQGYHRIFYIKSALSEIMTVDSYSLLRANASWHLFLLTIREQARLLKQKLMSRAHAKRPTMDR